MKEELEKLRKENEELLFENKVLKTENEFMKNNIKRLSNLKSTEEKNKSSILRRCLNKLKRIIKK